ncbi:MAG: hypothetical protein KME35_23810 [Aphanocapsa sp. GSE-SYN-MK-11-07L]|jgi:hypothetical protein|nr:hypothetical protein [Aphanocapsa sp. GSE-SYN-MK-11-07L]
MLDEHQVARLYNLAKASTAQWGFCKSTATIWTYNVRSQELYSLACEIAGTESLMGEEILPTIFSQEGAKLIESVVKNEYYFWKVASEFTSYLPETDLAEAIQRAISEIRNWHTRIGVNRFVAQNGTMTPQQICQFTAIGLLLWSDSTQNWVLNPLWFWGNEFAELAIAPSLVEA